MPTAVTDEAKAGKGIDGERMRPSRLAIRVLSKTDLSDFEMEIRVRQVISLARLTPVHAVGNLGNGIAFAAVFWNSIAHWLVALWLMLFVAFSGAQLQRWQRKRNWPTPQKVSRRAAIDRTYWALAAGMLWFAATLYAFPRGDTIHQLFIAFLAGGLGAGAVATMAIQPIACLAYVLPIVAPVPVLLILKGGSVFDAMAAIMGLYVLVLITALASGFSSFTAMIRTKIENRTLASGLAESRESSRAKSQFLATMSHELRTPLNAIIGFSQLIKDEVFGPVGNSDYREYASDINGSGQHLLDIINDVLDMSNLDMNKLTLNTESVDVDALVESALHLVHKAAAEKNVKITVNLPPALPALSCDGQRVKQILFNLLSNAVKFNHLNGQVRLSVVCDAAGLAIGVADNGIGMSANAIAAAMEPFNQLGDAFVRDYDGIGLGLPLAQALIRLHGGRLTLSSTLDAGTTATVIFPPELLQSSARPESTIAA